MLVEAVAVSERPASFDDFVAARSSALWRSAWLLTGDAQRAEDLVQTALAKTYPHFSRIADGFEGYVRTAMFRTYLSWCCLLYTSPSPRDGLLSRMPSSA